jgi:hypothetical protein
MFYCLAADRQGQADARLTLTSSVIPNSNYVIIALNYIDITRKFLTLNYIDITRTFLALNYIDVTRNFLN